MKTEPVTALSIPARTPPVWWSPAGRFVKFEPGAETDPSRTFRSPTAVIIVTPNLGGGWKIHAATSVGRNGLQLNCELTTSQLKEAFAIEQASATNRMAAKFYDADAMVLGMFIRGGRYLNFVSMGAGKETDLTPSILLTDEIITAVNTLIEEHAIGSHD